MNTKWIALALFASVLVICLTVIAVFAPAPVVHEVFAGIGVGMAGLAVMFIFAFGLWYLNR